MNPTDVLSQKARMVLYFAATVLLLGITAWTAANGDYAVAASTFLSSLVTLLSGSKTTSNYVVSKKEG